MGVVGAVLNADSVDTTAGDKGVRAVLNADFFVTTAPWGLSEQY